MDGSAQDGPFWQRVKEAFGDAFERDEGDRALFLDHLGREDPALRAEVVSLLSSLQAAGDDRGFEPRERGHAAGREALPGHLGRYRILSRLGAGGMGEVLLAHDPILDREVALKLLPGDFSRAGRGRGQFLREARAAAGLNHPHITTIHEVGEVEGRCYIALEFVRGRSLREHLAGRVVGGSELLDLALPLAEALAFAHARGIVHRDVKATNVMVTEQGTPKLLDFGLAQRTSDGWAVRLGDDDAPIGGRVFGTPAAMSPEQALGQDVDGRSDIFSFGSLLHEMATGRPAFAGVDVRRTLEAVVSAEAADLATTRPDLPPGFVALVRHCMDKSPSGRPADMATVARSLRAIRDGLPEVGVAPDVGRAPAMRREVRRSRGLSVLVGMLSVALVWWLARGPADSPAPLAATPALAALVAIENADDPQDADVLGSMLARLLRAHLAASDSGLPLLGEARVLDAARSLGLPDGPIPVGRAADVARASGASVMLVGRVRRASDGLSARIEVTDLVHGDLLGAAQADGRSTADLFEMAGSLGRQVRLLLAAPALSGEERSALERQYTSSIDAYRAFVRGLSELEHGRSEDAAVALREAVTLDPAFALAHFRLAMALVWTGDFEAIRPAVERALAFREKLPDDVRLVLDALPSYFYTDETRESLPLLEAALAEDPRNLDALFMLGEIRTHSSTRNDAHEAVRLYERILELDPGYSLVHEHMLSALLRLGRDAAAETLLDHWAAAGTEDIALLGGVLALWRGDFNRAAALLDDPLPARLLGGDDEVLADLAARDVDALLAGLVGVHGVARVVGLGLRAEALLLRGRPDDAALLHRLAAENEGMRSRDGFHTTLRSCERLRLAALLELRGDRDGARREVGRVLADQPDTPRFLFVGGAFAAREGDVALARVRLETLEEIVRAGWTPTSSLYRDGLRGEIALAEGRATEARRIFAALVGSGALMQDWYAFESSAGPLWREGWARACLASGDARGAATVLDGLFAAGYERLGYASLEVSAHGLRARLAAESGDIALARVHVACVLAALGGTDWPLAVEMRALHAAIERN